MLRRKYSKKYITFSVLIKKELDNSKTVTYKQKFIDSFRFMSTSLSSFVDNLSEKLHSDRCKDCKFEVDYMSVKDNQLISQCVECNFIGVKRIIVKIVVKNYLKDLQKHMNFAKGTLINLFCY